MNLPEAACSRLVALMQPISAASSAPSVLSPSPVTILRATIPVTPSSSRTLLRRPVRAWIPRREARRNADTNERTPLLKVEHLSKEFPAESGMFAKRFSKRVVSAVNDISFEIYPGETFGLVGESGCGKSTTGRTIMRLTKPTAGKVFFQGKDVAEMSKHEIKDMRREMQFIFQDPYASLNPRMTIGEIVSEPMTIHAWVPRRSALSASASFSTSLD